MLYASCGKFSFDGLKNLTTPNAAAAPENQTAVNAPETDFENLDYSSEPSEVKPIDTEILDAIAETERSSGFIPGLGVSESTLREKSGDYAGAVIAAYKELAYAYSYSVTNESAAGTLSFNKQTMEDAFRNVKNLYLSEEKQAASGERGKDAVKAAEAALFFVQDKYQQSKEILTELFINDDEPDSFAKWMILVCDIETDKNVRAKQAAYGAIRARYETFPAYWYYGAKNFHGALAADYAEHCINLSPKGPYNTESRSILAVFSGLKAPEGKALRSKKEIDETIKNSVRLSDPEILHELLPLISLNDNPFTLYAAGALRALSANIQFKNWFTYQAEAARKTNSGESRLADRLQYIARG
ncbi:hypothetical protein AGMMS50212_12690 [Spirochaetia bacterium]|nr:hypothetical protein AGMMS50212_12690 [Spirochaetia bacterium]